jgi:hypothetical protein
LKLPCVLFPPVEKLNIGLTLILLMWRIWWAFNNVNKWQTGFNSAFKVLTLILLTWRIWWAPNYASIWKMGFTSAFKGLLWFICFDYYSPWYLIKVVEYDLNIPNQNWSILKHKEIERKFIVYF